MTLRKKLFDQIAEARRLLQTEGTHGPNSVIQQSLKNIPALKNNASVLAAIENSLSFTHSFKGFFPQSGMLSKNSAK